MSISTHLRIKEQEREKGSTNMKANVLFFFKQTKDDLMRGSSYSIKADT